MGVYYRSPSPGEPAFVEIGDHVAIGDPIGTIEAMKVFSEVISEVAGVIVAIPAENGNLVHSGDSLVVIEEA
jgi:acetyl-CoA carboxylase biotin carboxyl carrier protein